MADWISFPADQELLDTLWFDHPEGVVLDTLLASAQVLCEAFAPVKVPFTQISKQWKLAVLLTARDMHRSINVDADGSFGPDGMAVTVFALSRVVKSLLRPSSGAGKRGAH